MINTGLQDLALVIERPINWEGYFPTTYRFLSYKITEKSQLKIVKKQEEIEVINNEQ
jgi:hypothetical protein